MLAATLVGAVTGGAAAESAPDPENIHVASVHAMVTDLRTDRVLYAKRAKRVVPIASLTKVMTAMVVLDSGASLDEWLTIVAREDKAPNNAWSRFRIGSRARRGGASTAADPKEDRGVDASV